MNEHGALAGIQLAYSGINGPNFYTKEVPRAVGAADPHLHQRSGSGARDGQAGHPGPPALARQRVQARQARGFRPGLPLRGARLRHLPALPVAATNQRTDEYGGSLENRSRFVNEVIGDIRDAIGDTWGSRCGSARRDDRDLGFSNAEVRDFIAMNADLPDLWDLAQGAWEDAPGRRASRRRRRRRRWSPASRAHLEAGGRRRALHLARRDGPDDRPAASISSAAPGRRSPIRSCRGRSRKGGSRTSASASAATSASPAT